MLQLGKENSDLCSSVKQRLFYNIYGCGFRMRNHKPHRSHYGRERSEGKRRRKLGNETMKEYHFNKFDQEIHFENAARQTNLSYQ